MAAVAQNGLALEFGSEEMKGDRELCTAAVAQKWCSLKYISDVLKKDEEIIIAAIYNWHKCFPECKSSGDAARLKKALEVNFWTDDYIPAAMRENMTVRQVAGLSTERNEAERTRMQRWLHPNGE